MKYFYLKSQLTLRPASLLCRFIRPSAVSLLSWESTKSLLNFSPKWISYWKEKTKLFKEEPLSYKPGVGNLWLTSYMRMWSYGSSVPYANIIYFIKKYILLAANTQSCEQAFSCMNIIRSRVRSQLTTGNLESCLQLKTSYQPNVSKLSKTMQSHRSHWICLLKCMLLFFF